MYTEVECEKKLKLNEYFFYVEQKKLEKNDEKPTI